jgi:hypothetical protein
MLLASPDVRQELDLLLTISRKAAGSDDDGTARIHLPPT